MAVIVVRLALAVMFGVAAVAKLGDRDGVRRTVVDVGLGPRFAAWFVWALIGSELAVAAALVVDDSARVGGLAAVVLVGFAAALAFAVARGRHPECRCFGRLRSEPVGWSTVARNLALAAVAAVVATGGRDLPALGGLVALGVIAWAALKTRELGGPRRGSPAPALSLTDLAGVPRTVESLLAAGRPLLLVFSEPGCGACRELLPWVAQRQRQESALTVVAVSGGDADDSRRVAAELDLRMVLVDHDHAALAAYGVNATPTAVLVDEHGRIAADPAVGAEEIVALAGRAVSPEPMLARRTVLARAAVGVAAVTVVPLIDSAGAAARGLRQVARPRKLKVDGVWLCDQRYALCTTASCTPSKTEKGISICRCKVKSGYSAGYKTCEQRAPEGRRLHSQFSLQNGSERLRMLTCNERGLWANCLDVVCEVDPDDPRHALCRCVDKRTKNFYTLGGDCDTRACQSVIWSAETGPGVGAQYEKGLRSLGITYRSPPGCPSPAKRR